MSHWTDEKLCQLATLYSQFNNLWDRNHPCYYNRQCRFDSYDEIRKGLSMPGATVIHVLSKLWDLRSDYVAELHQVQLAEKENFHYRPKKKWFYIMNRFFYDFLDSDEKLTEDSCVLSTSSENIGDVQGHFEDRKRIPPQGKVLFIRCPTELDVKKQKKAQEYSGRDQRTEKNSIPSRNNKACVECEVSCQKDNRNLSRCCQEMMKERNLEKGHSSKSGRKSHQNSIYDMMEKKASKSSYRRSKRGQCASSSCFECLYQDQEEPPRKFRTTSELRRSTFRPTSLKEDEFSCCKKTNKTRPEYNFSKFNREHSNFYPREFKCGKCNQNLTDGGKNEDFGATVDVYSPDFLASLDDQCDEDNLELNKSNPSTRVIYLEELKDLVVEALNEMFLKLCPVDVACIPPYCTNETCTSAKEKESKMPQGENEKNNDQEAVGLEDMNEKENPQTEESSKDKTHSDEGDDFDQFGAEVARILKEANREKALRLKAAIKQTLNHEMWSRNEFRRSLKYDRWTDQKINKLVCLYRKYQCLWKKDNPAYLDTQQRYCAYKKIHRNIGMPSMTFIEVLMEIRDVRRMYICELQKILLAQSNGYYYEPRSTWFWDMHQFLYPYLDYDEITELHKVLSNCVSNEEEDYENVESHGTKNNSGRGDDWNSSGRSDIYFPLRKYSSSGVENGRSPIIDTSSKLFSTKASRPFPTKTAACSSDQTIGATIATSSCNECTNSMKSSMKTYIISDESRTVDKKPLHFCRKKDLAISGSESREDCIQSDISCLTVQKSCDQFDLFAKSVACQLRKMNLNSALKIQKEIQRILKYPQLSEITKEFRSVETETKNCICSDEGKITKSVQTEAQNTASEGIHCQDKPNTLRTCKPIKATCTKPKSHYYLKFETRDGRINENCWRC